jgi:4-amino-4-deoxy-L-arabinose transferase-like glycosyltransferase
MIAALSAPFGYILEFTARLPALLAAIGTLLLTMRLGSRWFGPRTAAMSGAILATAYMFWEKARVCQPEAVLCFLIWLSLSVFLDAREDKIGSKLPGAVFWLALALALLTKWLVGLVIVLGIVATVVLFDRKPGVLKRLAPISGPLILCSIVGAWLIAVEIWGPDGYSVWGAVREQFFERGIQGMHHISPPWFYLTNLPVSLLPWTGLLPGALYLAWRRRRCPEDLFLMITVAFIVGIYSLSPEKRELYMLPTFPAIALMMANLVGTVAGWRDDASSTATAINRRWVTAGQGVVGGLMLLIGLALPVVGTRIDQVPFWTVVTTAVVVLGLGGSTLWFASRGRSLHSVFATAAGTSILFLFVTAVIFPIINPIKSDRAIAEATAIASVASDLPVMAFRTRNLPRALAFYGDGLYTTESWGLGELERHLRQEEPVFAVLYANDLEEVRPAIRDRLTIVAREPHSSKEVLLISN